MLENGGTMKTEDQIREQVRNRYTAAVSMKSGCCASTSHEIPAERVACCAGYSEEEPEIDSSRRSTK